MQWGNRKAVTRLAKAGSVISDRLFFLAVSSGDVPVADALLQARSDILQVAAEDYRLVHRVMLAERLRGTDRGPMLQWLFSHGADRNESLTNDIPSPLWYAAGVLVTHRHMYRYLKTCTEVLLQCGAIADSYFDWWWDSSSRTPLGAAKCFQCKKSIDIFNAASKFNS